jgi:CubicO group peptidase (beta-lactamase class C family)
MVRLFQKRKGGFTRSFEEVNGLLILSVLIAFLPAFTFTNSQASSEALEQSAGDIIKNDLGAEIQAKLEPIINETIESYDLPGLAIGIVKDKEIVYARGFGFKNIDTREPITVKTLFHMASVSKTFVATAIMQLVEKEKINLNAAIIDYLPYFKLKDEQYKGITVQQMLSHVSGMPDVKDYEWDKPKYDPGALERFVHSLSKKEMISEPGDKFSYSNMAFECLGDVIAKVSGMSFAGYEKKYVLNPSGMKESTFLKPKGLPENWASPHLRTVKTLAWDGYPYNRKHGPSSTLHSNVLEMCSWAVINMNHGILGGRKILEPSSYEELWTPKVQTGAGGMSKSIGLSWFLGESKGEKTISHRGRDIGFNTSFVLMPEKEIAVVVLCNFAPAPASDLSSTALDIVLGLKPQVLKPPASVLVLRTLADQGVEAAVEKWKTLKRDFPKKYDFQEQHFINPAGMAIILDRVEDAKKLAKLCLALLSKPSLNFASRYINSYLITHPGNNAAAAMREIMEKK